MFKNAFDALYSSQPSTSYTSMLEEPFIPPSRSYATLEALNALAKRLDRLESGNEMLKKHIVNLMAGQVPNDQEKAQETEVYILLFYTF